MLTDYDKLTNIDLAEIILQCTKTDITNDLNPDSPSFYRLHRLIAFCVQQLFYGYTSNLCDKKLKTKLFAFTNNNVEMELPFDIIFLNHIRDTFNLKNLDNATWTAINAKLVLILPTLLKLTSEESKTFHEQEKCHTLHKNVSVPYFSVAGFTISHAHLKNLNLSGVDFTGTQFKHCVLENLNLAEAILIDCWLIHTTIKDCKVARASFNIVPVEAVIAPALYHRIELKNKLLLEFLQKKDADRYRLISKMMQPLQAYVNERCEENYEKADHKRRCKMLFAQSCMHRLLQIQAAYIKQPDSKILSELLSRFKAWLETVRKHPEAKDLFKAFMNTQHNFSAYYDAFVNNYTLAFTAGALHTIKPELNFNKYPPIKKAATIVPTLPSPNSYFIKPSNEKKKKGWTLTLPKSQSTQEELFEESIPAINPAKPYIYDDMLAYMASFVPADFNTLARMALVSKGFFKIAAQEYQTRQAKMYRNISAIQRKGENLSITTWYGMKQLILIPDRHALKMVVSNMLISEEELTPEAKTLVCNAEKMLNKSIKKVLESGERVLALSTEGNLYIMSADKKFLADVGAAKPICDTIVEVAIPNQKKIIDIAIGKNHYLWLTTDNKVYGFGSNESLQLGLNAQITYQAEPVQLLIPDSMKILQIAATPNESVFLMDNGCLWSYGEDFPSNKQLENGMKLLELPAFVKTYLSYEEYCLELVQPDEDETIKNEGLQPSLSL